jgi:nucleoside phosphorylase
MVMKSSQKNGVDLPRVIILTAIPVEFDAVRLHLSQLHEVVHPKGTVYEQGIYADGQPRINVLLGQIGVGNEAAAMEAERAINYFNPSLAFFIGVAGGVKDVSLGDVVVSTKVYGYESGAAKKIFEPRPDVGESSYSLVQRAIAESRKSEWLSRIKSSMPHAMPNVHIGPIAAGAKVVKSTRSNIYKFLRSTYGDALAVEMEGRGFLKATRANEEVKALVIRGISDLINKKAAADASGFQAQSSMHASAFAFQILASLSTENAAAGKTHSTIRMRPTIHQNELIPNKADLRRLLLQAFDRERLELLCADINARLQNEKTEVRVTPEIVGGRGLEAIILNLIEYLDRRGLLHYLLEAVRNIQPGIF